MPDIVFDGGPYHGRRSIVTRLPARVTVAYMKPLPVLTWEPRPSRWRHPWRWLRWRPAPLPPIPEAQMLAYADTGATRDGARVYAIGGGWPWFKGPQISDDGDLHKALAAAMYAPPPTIRRDPQTRWVMDLDWYKRIRATAVRPGADPDEDDPADPATWKPSPEDMLMGIRIDVCDDGGAPHLENRRYPADYP